MPLCDVCKSVAFEDLPPFPEDEYIRTGTGLERVQRLVRNKKAFHDAAASSVRHHANIDALQGAATQGCELCLLVKGEADSMLAELESLEGVAKRIYSLPTFDMWLTKRPDGGQGFWIMSECGPSTEGMFTAPIAAFGFAVAEDDPLASIFRGRPVKRDPDAQTLQLLVKWNSECEHNHECCQDIGPMPSRLINVQSSKVGDTVRLVTMDVWARQKYTALTYLSESGIVDYWKDINPLENENSNISVAGLPQMFQDAVLVTRTLGVQYLWIDSICIPGNPREWARDAEQAAFVYANAYLTISATGSGNVTDGLLFPRPLRTSVQIPYRTSDDIAGILSVSVLPLAKEVIRSQYIEMKEEPISQGIWSFQERVFSPRIVHFAGDQMYFECLRHFVSEDGLLEHLRYHTTVEKLPNGSDHFRKRAGKDGDLFRWFSMLWDYGQRHSTIPSDKLLGISNIARAFQRMLDDEYVAGHWKESLIESLCWQSLRCKPARDSSIPSWSWASVDGTPVLGFRAGSTHFTATIINTRVSLQDDAKPFGKLTEASIELEAPLIPLRLLEKKEHAEHISVRTDNGDEEGFYPNFDTIDSHHATCYEFLQDRKLFALVLAKTHQGECSNATCDMKGSRHGLIVTPFDASGDKMMRLGFILSPSLSFGNDELLDSYKTITLV